MSVEHASQPRLRKDLQQAVQTLLDFVHEENASRLVLAKQPLQLPPRVSATSLSKESLPKSALADHFPLGLRWPQFRVHSISFPSLICVVEGELHERIGFPHVTKKQGNAGLADRIELEDCHVLKLPASTFLFLPSDVGFSYSDQLPGEFPLPESSCAQVLRITFLTSEILCHLSIHQGTIYKSHLSLQIKDKGLLALWDLMTEELADNPSGSDGSAQALLHLLLVRLQRRLAQSQANVSDGLTFLLPSPDMPPSQSYSHLPSLLRNAIEFIHLNLHETLTSTIISEQVESSPSQLNHQFRAAFNMSIMQYVTTQRLNAAKAYLRFHQLSIAEVGHLFGYKDPAHFSRVFRESEGISPSKYRRQHA